MIDTTCERKGLLAEIIKEAGVEVENPKFVIKRIM